MKSSVTAAAPDTPTNKPRHVMNGSRTAPVVEPNAIPPAIAPNNHPSGRPRSANGKKSPTSASAIGTTPLAPSPVTVVVAQIARRDDAKAADEAERAGFGAAKGVLAVMIADQLTFESARQVELVYEGVSRIDGVTVAGVIVTFTWIASPARIIVEHRPANLHTMAFVLR